MKFTKEQKDKAKDVFNRYPEAVSIYLTSDGNVFLARAYATNHSQSLDDAAVLKITRTDLLINDIGDKAIQVEQIVPAAIEEPIVANTVAPEYNVVKADNTAEPASAANTNEPHGQPVAPEAGDALPGGTKTLENEQGAKAKTSKAK